MHSAQRCRLLAYYPHPPLFWKQECYCEFESSICSNNCENPERSLRTVRLGQPETSISKHSSACSFKRHWRKEHILEGTVGSQEEKKERKVLLGSMGKVRRHPQQGTPEILSIQGREECSLSLSYLLVSPEIMEWKVMLSDFCV